MSLSRTIIQGTTEQVSQLIAAGAPTDTTDEYGYTPLIQTAIMDNIDMAKLLLEKHVDVNRSDLTGTSALHWAVENHNLPFCQLLLKNGADPNAYTESSEPVVAKAILRKQKELRRLLHRYGANMAFAEDYIHAKLLGHRFELKGYANIVDADNHFTEMDFEGFFLEFSMNLMRQSLIEFRTHFTSKDLHIYFDTLDALIQSFITAQELLKFEHYQIDIKKHQFEIDRLLSRKLLLIPVSYEGHAVAFVKFGNLLAKCDRSKNEEFTENVVIYRINRPAALTHDFLKNLMYKRQYKQYIDIEMVNVLELEPLMELPMTTQITGNCSWANIVACVPVIIFMASLTGSDGAEDILRYKKFALYFYQKWREWDKDRALYYCIKQFPKASPARKASLVAMLAAVFFQRCSPKIKRDIERARKIYPILKSPGYEYALESYIEVFCHQSPSKAGENLKQLIYLCED